MLIILIVSYVGCKSVPIKPVVELESPATLAVLDFKAPNNPDDAKYVKGWWLGARDIYKNKNAGMIYADIFAEELQKISSFDVYKRSEYKYYRADLESTIKKKFSAFDDDKNVGKLEEVLVSVDPIIIGKELGVDRVLTGEVDSYFTSHHRAFHNWSSKVEVSAKIIEVSTGKVEWEAKYADKKSFSAPNVISKKIISKMIKDIKKNYSISKGNNRNLWKD